MQILRTTRTRLVALLVGALVAAPAASAATLTAPESALLTRINVVRTAHGLAPLRVDDHLQRAALAHTRRMLAKGVFAHGAFATRLARFDVRGRITGENLAWLSDPDGAAAVVVSAWLASPEHRANLLRASFTRVGVGELEGSFEGYDGADVVTADFAG